MTDQTEYEFRDTRDYLADLLWVPGDELTPPADYLIALDNAQRHIR